MKTICILFNLVLTSMLCAQPVLTGSNMQYRLGDAYIITQNEYPNWVTSIDVSETGADYTWDYSALNVPFTDGKLAVLVKPQSTVFADSVIQADVCIKSCDGDTGSYQFIKQSAASIDLTGIGWYEMANSSFSKYDPFKKIFSLPLTYGDTFEDDNVLMMRHEQGSLYLDSSQVVNVVDGYGTLLTPAATYTDVLRIKRTTAYASYINVQGMWIKTINTTVIDYHWYKPGVPVALFTIADGYDAPGNLMVSYLSHWNSTPVTNASVVNEINAYPNPFENHLSIEMGEQYINQIKVFDINGKMIFDKTLTGKDFELNTEKWFSGTYIIRIAGKDKLYSKMLIRR